MDDNREYRLHHVVVGFCANLQLSCSMRLQQRVDAISLGCRQLLETSADLITMAADIPDLEAWMLSVTRGTGHSLEIVGAVLKSKSSDYEPVVLAPPTQYLHSRAARTDRMRGTSAFAFRAGRVPALFQVFRGPGCALYMCLRDGAPVPNIDETLAEYYLRGGCKGGATLVYCTIDSYLGDMWKFCGISTHALLAIYANMLAEGSVFASITDPEAVSVDAPSISMGLRCVLPILHLDIRRGFRDSLFSKGGCSTDLSTFPLRTSTAESATTLGGGLVLIRVGA